MDCAFPLLAALFTLTPASSATPPAAQAAPASDSTAAEPPAAAPPPAATPVEPPATAKAAPRASLLEEVAGSVREIDRKAHRLTVDTGGGKTVILSLDRNTMVYTQSGLGTVLDITPGTSIRAGRNADLLAYWVQVRAVAPAAQQPSGKAAGPAPASSGPPPSEGGKATGVPADAGKGAAAKPRSGGDR